MQIINDALLDCFRAQRRCEACGKKADGCQPHHLFGRGCGGGSRLDVAINLAHLCATCHQGLHCSNEPSRKRVLEIVSAREKMKADDLVAEIRRLMRMPSDAGAKADPREVQVDTDGNSRNPEGDGHDGLPGPVAGPVPGDRLSGLAADEGGWHAL